MHKATRRANRTAFMAAIVIAVTAVYVLWANAHGQHVKAQFAVGLGVAALILFSVAHTRVGYYNRQRSHRYPR